MDNCWKLGVIKVRSESAGTRQQTAPNHSKIRESGNNYPTTSEASTVLGKPYSDNEASTLEVRRKKPDMNETGIYMAYPTTSTLKPIYRGYKTLVNNEHTKVGMAQDSFYARKHQYMNTFDGEVKFIPIAEVGNDVLEAVETKILGMLSIRFRKVGRAREWFDTDDRDLVLKVICEGLTEF